MPRVASDRLDVSTPGRWRVPVMMAAAIVVAAVPATPTWAQQQPRAAEQRLLFEPSALDAWPGAFDRRAAQPSSPARQADDEAAAKNAGNRSFAPLQENGALALPGGTLRDRPNFGSSLLDKRPGEYSLGVETESKFKPDELPTGEKTHALSYQRELHPKPFLGFSLTSPTPIE